MEVLKRNERKLNLRRSSMSIVRSISAACVPGELLLETEQSSFSKYRACVNPPTACEPCCFADCVLGGVSSARTGESGGVGKVWNFRSQSLPLYDPTRKALGVGNSPVMPETWSWYMSEKSCREKGR